MDPVRLAPAALAFSAERHLATLTTLRRDGTPHVVAVGWTWDPDGGIARVITSDGSQKVRNAAAGGPGAICQVDGRRWLTVEGRVVVLTDPASVADAERRYAGRYREPRPNPQRVVLALRVTRVLGSADLLAG